MVVTLHSVAFSKMKQAFTPSLHRVALCAGCTELFGRKKRSTKPIGPQAASPGQPMGSISPFLIVHPTATRLLLFFCYRAIPWKLAESLGRCIRGVIPTLNSPPTAKHWRSPEFQKEFCQSTQCRFQEEMNNALLQV
jgi:hypothetical protein